MADAGMKPEDVDGMLVIPETTQLMRLGLLETWE